MNLPRPAAGTPRNFSFPGFRVVDLANGSRVYMAPVRKLPIVTLTAVVDAGASVEPAGKEGVAQLVAQLLTEGAGHRDSVGLTESLEVLGTSLSASADWDSTSLSLTMMSRNFDSVLEIMGDILMRPLFPARELERLKQERLADIMQLVDDPRSLAAEMYTALLYNRESRYGRPMDGTQKSVGTMTLEDIQFFHQSHYTPAATSFVVVGDFQEDECVAALNRIFAAWRGAVAVKPLLVSKAASSGRQMHLVPREGAPQSELRIGHVGLERSHPDFFNVVMMNSILGGLFSSRINLNLRERHGYTYGAFSHFLWRRGAGPFEVSTAVGSEVTSAAITEVLKEIDGMRAGPVSEEELSLARDYMVGVFPIRFETTAAIAGALASLIIYDLPHDYFNSYRSRIAAVTSDDILTAAKEHLHPDRLQIVVVGDSAVVTEPLIQLSDGALQVHDPVATLNR